MRIMIIVIWIIALANHRLGMRELVLLPLFAALIICLFFAHDASAISVVATIPIGTSPNAIAYDPVRGEIFVTNSDDSVSVISDTNNTVIATIPVGHNPNAVVYDPAVGEIFVANSGYNPGVGSVSVISDITNTVIATVSPVGGFPISLAYDSGKGKIFVANFVANVINAIPDTTYILGTWNIGDSTTFRGIAYDPANGEIYVTNSNDAVIVISDDGDFHTKIITTYAVGNLPESIAYDSGKGEMFVANLGSNSTSVISDGTHSGYFGPSTIPVGTYPWGVAYDSTRGEIFVTNNRSNSVSVISDTTNTVIATIPVGSFPTGIAYDSAKGEIFVANTNDNSVSVISDAASFTAVASGNWSSSTTWGGIIPSPSDNVTIPSGITVTIPSGYLVQVNSGGIISNFGIINNYFMINNSGGTIINSGTLNNECGETITGLVSGNPVANLPCNTSITLNSISSVPWGKKITISGQMVDEIGRNVVGATISFYGTGASSIKSVTTDVNGMFTTTGTAPNTVQSGWTVQANFAGNSTLNSSHSNIVAYSTISHHTLLTLTQPPNVNWGQATNFVATLSDSDNGGVGISGISIHFNGTGVLGVADTYTVSNGVATSHGTTPTTVKTGWTAEATFTPTANRYFGSHSSILKYSTLKHPTSLTMIIKPNPVPHNTGYAISGILKDTTTGSGLSVRTIQFVTNNSAVIIPPILTNSTGGYTISGLVAPNLAGKSAQIQATYGTQPLYVGTAVLKLLKIT